MVDKTNDFIYYFILIKNNGIIYLNRKLKIYFTYGNNIIIGTEITYSEIYQYP
jgi:hypothetical protein